MKNMKRIHKVTIKRMIDESPDTSWLGEYGNNAESDYAIDRAHSEDCSAVKVNYKQAVDQLERAIDYLKGELGSGLREWDDAIDLLIEKQEECQECDCGFSGQWNNREYRYFNPNYENYKGLSEDEIRKYCKQEFDRMESLNNQQWGFIGIRAEADYSVDNSQLIQEATSGGLWGIESDSDASYFTSVEQEELAELRKQLEGIGFSKRAIAAAFKNVEHSDE